MNRACLVGLVLFAWVGCASQTPTTTLPDVAPVLRWGSSQDAGSAWLQESITIRLAFEGGGFGHVSLDISNRFGEPGRARIAASLQLGDGQAAVATATAPRDGWRPHPTGVGVIMGPSFVSLGQGEGEVRVVGRARTVHIRIRGGLAPLRPGGLVVAGAAQPDYEVAILIPRGRAEVVVEPSNPGLDTGDVLRASAVAYVDHRFSAIAPYDLFQRSFELMEFTPERTLVVSAFQRPQQQGAGIIGTLLVADSTGIVQYVPHVDIRIDETERLEPYDVPRRVTVLDGDSRVLEIIAGEMISRRERLEGANPLKRLVLSRLVVPVVYGFSALYRLLGPAPAVGGGGTTGEASFWYEQNR